MYKKIMIKYMIAMTTCIPKSTSISKNKNDWKNKKIRIKKIMKKWKLLKLKKLRLSTRISSFQLIIIYCKNFLNFNIEINNEKMKKYIHKLRIAYYYVLDLLLLNLCYLT